MTEQERFGAWYCKHREKQHDNLWYAHENIAAVRCLERLNNAHDDMWKAWQAAIAQAISLLDDVQCEIARKSFLAFDEDANEVCVVDANELDAFIVTLIKAKEISDD